MHQDETQVGPDILKNMLPVELMVCVGLEWLIEWSLVIVPGLSHDFPSFVVQYRATKL